VVVGILALLLPETGLTGALVTVVVAGGLGTVVYLGVCVALGTRDVRELRRLIPGR